MKKILVTGANGFVGKNLVAELRNRGYNELYLFNRENSFEDLENFTKDCDFVFHLAGVNRPVDKKEFIEGNQGLTSQLLQFLIKNDNKVPVLITSSIQAAKDNAYGKSKKAAEDELFIYSKETGASIFVYRLPNLFGKWSKPNYNSVVATYCYNIARGKEITINNPTKQLELAYINEVLEEFLKALDGKQTSKGHFCKIPVQYKIKVGELAELINSFKNSRENLLIPNTNDELTKRLYSTYLSFLPEEEFSYDLKMNVDHRGSFTEFIRTPERGQVSVNISRPGVTKGNHWHHTKNEKFLVVSGKGLIKLRNIYSDDIIEYFVEADALKVIDIPIGYTHSIVNIGDTDLVTIMWVNEIFNPKSRDTYYMEVQNEKT